MEKPPLRIKVLFHTQFKKGKTYLKNIYRLFARDPDYPLQRGIGIPVIMETYEGEFTAPVNVSSKSTDPYLVYIIFVDDNMLISPAWIKYLTKLADWSGGNNVNAKVLPVAVTKNYSKIEGSFSRLNTIRSLNSDKGELGLHVELAQEIASLIYDRSQSNSHAPVRFFLSYARKDGKKLAEAIKLYIAQYYRLNTFFDTNDIERGNRFGEEIEAGVRESVVVALQTDIYASRPWCQQEMMLAKKHNVPLVVLSAYRKGEERSFPYMANVPVIRFRRSNLDKINKGEEINPQIFDEIILMVLLEAIRFKYHELKCRYLCKLYKVPLSKITILNQAPELYSLLHNKPKKIKAVVYPDPPISDKELIQLQAFDRQLKFFTPLTLPFFKKKALLRNKKIGISISENLELEELDMLPEQLQDMAHELARYLLNAQAQIAYGGKLRYQAERGEDGEIQFNKSDFVSLLEALVKTYQSEYGEAKPIINYVAYPLSQSYDAKVIAQFLKSIHFNLLPAFDDQAMSQEGAKKITNLENLDSRIFKSRGFTQMRKEMANDLDSLIVVGGKRKGFAGKYPGLVEEVYEMMKAEKPVYLIGAFGGQAGALIDALKGKRTEILKLDFHTKNNKDYSELVNSYKDMDEPVAYNELIQFFKAKKIKGLNNGLTVAQNEVLFTSVNTSEIIHLILKGLSKK